MNASQIYIGISIAVLAVVAILFFIKRENRQQKALTPLAGLAFGFILAGILFGDNRLIGYSLLGVGVLLAVVDMINKSKRK